MAEFSCSELSDEFEFQSCDSSMCSADEVFSQGLIRPSKPYSALGRGTRSKSLPSAFSSSRSSSGSQRPQRSMSNNFYAHPSPTPRLLATKRRRRIGSRRAPSKKTSSWGLFRLGVMKTPEIELGDLRSRSESGSSCKSRSLRCTEDERTRGVKDGGDECCYENIYYHFDGEGKERRKTKWCFGGGGMFGCKCSGEVAADAISCLVLVGKERWCFEIGKRSAGVHA